jgi:hypothetical protein
MDTKAADPDVVAALEAALLAEHRQFLRLVGRLPFSAQLARWPLWLSWPLVLPAATAFALRWVRSARQLLAGQRALERHYARVAEVDRQQAQVALGQVRAQLRCLAGVERPAVVAEWRRGPVLRPGEQERVAGALLRYQLAGRVTTDGWLAAAQRAFAEVQAAEERLEAVADRRSGASRRARARAEQRWLAARDDHVRAWRQWARQQPA